MESNFEVYTSKEVQKEMWRLLCILMLLFGTIIMCVFINNRIESPFILRFSDNFSVDDMETSYYNRTDDSFNTININNESYLVNYTIFSIEIAFQNKINSYTDQDIVNSYIYNNGTNNLLNELIYSGNYIIRSFIFDNNNESPFSAIDFKFKIKDGYKLLFMRIRINILNDTQKYLDFYRFFASDILTISQTDGYIIEISSFTQTINYIYPHKIEIILYKSNTLFFMAYDVSFR